MPELKNVWAIDTRFSDQEPFQHPAHLVQMSEFLKQVDRPKRNRQAKITEPAKNTTPSTSKKNEEK